MEDEKLSPTFFVRGGRFDKDRNFLQQNLLLRALKVTQDPEKLKTMVGFKNVSEVYKTLDKLAYRREYAEALQDAGLDLKTIVLGIKDICQNAVKDDVRLKGYQTILKSLGLDTYKESEAKERETWEELVRKNAEKTDKPETNFIGQEDYEVLEPVMPSDEKIKMEQERDEGKRLFLKK